MSTCDDYCIKKTSMLFSSMNTWRSLVFYVIILFKNFWNICLHDRDARTYRLHLFMILSSVKVTNVDLHWEKRTEYEIEIYWRHWISDESWKTTKMKVNDWQIYHVWDSEWVSRDEWMRCMWFHELLLYLAFFLDKKGFL